MGERNKHHICNLIPCQILWYIWTERNGCVHREIVFKVENVCHRVMAHLRNLVIAGHLGPEQWSGCVPKVDFMEAQAGRNKPKKVVKLQWRPPEQSWMKINIDGAFEGSTNRAGGGGLLRNCFGDIVEAFCTPVKADSGWEAEVMALLEGVMMAKRHSQNIWIETDVETLGSFLEKGQLGPAKTRHTLARIRIALRDTTWRISHIRREGNKAADHLASLGKYGSILTTFTAGSASATVKALAQLDQIGMSSFSFG